MPSVELADYEKYALETIEDAFPDYLEFLKEFRKKLEVLDKYRRKRLSVSLATPTVEALKWFAEHIRDEEGNPIPISYIIEDMIIWILRDPVVFASFVGEMYQEEEVENIEEIDTEEESED